MKKKIFILSILALLTTTLRAADYQYLVFTLTDGTTQSITATNLTLTFANGTLTATSGTSTLSLPLTNLSKMEFSNDGSTTGISTLKADVKLDEQTEVYDMNGRRLPNSTQLQRGIYIIKNNGKTTKVQVK